MKLFNARFLFLPGVVLTGLSLLATPAHAQNSGSGVAGAMSNLFAVLCVVALVCLIWGWKDPKRFEFAFGDKATMPIVRGTFGVALLLFGFLGQSLDPNKSAAQVAANERRVAQSEAKVQDAKKRELEAKENERAARENQRKAQQEAKDSQTLARRAQKEKTRAENKAAAAKARQIRDDERARKQRESDSQEGSEGPKSKPLGVESHHILNKRR